MNGELNCRTPGTVRSFTSLFVVSFKASLEKHKLVNSETEKLADSSMIQ
jgi:hypothetical protein